MLFSYVICYALLQKAPKDQNNSYMRYGFVTCRQVKTRTIIMISFSKPRLRKYTHPCFTIIKKYSWCCMGSYLSSTICLMFCNLEQITQTLCASCVKWNTKKYLIRKVVLSIHNTLNVCKVLIIVPETHSRSINVIIIIKTNIIINNSVIFIV